MTEQPIPECLTYWNRRTLLVLSVILGAGALGTWWMVWQADCQMRWELLAQAKRTAQSLAPAAIEPLTGSPADLDSPHYQRLKRQLTLIRQADDKCRFVYLMGRRADDTVFLFADSEPPDSEDYSPPGQVYDEALETEATVFDFGRPVVAGPIPDRWGVWITAYAPIKNPWSDSVLAICGLDIDARDWNRRLVQAAVLPVLLTLIASACFVAGRILSVGRRRTPADEHRLWYIEPAWVAVVGLIGTFLAARIACNRETFNRSLAFAQLADSETGRAAEFLRGIEYVELAGLAKLFESSHEVTSDEFQRYAGALTRSPGIQAWQWLPAVSVAERASFEQKVRADGLPEFEIGQRNTAGQRIPATVRDVYYPVLYVVPASGNEALFGDDAGSERIRRTALEQAARTGLTTATPPIVLVQGSRPKKGLVIFRPVFRTHEPQRLEGFAVAVLWLEGLLVAAEEKTSVHLDLVLLRDKQPPEPLAGAFHEVSPASAKLATSRPMAAFGNVFFLLAHPSSEFLRSFPTRAGWLTALVGTLFTALVVLLISEPLRRRQELETLVTRRTASLRESEARYEQLAEQSRTFAWQVDVHGLYTYVNHVVEQVLGYRPDELVGKKYVYDLWPESARGELTAAIQEMRDRKVHVSNLENPMLSKDGRILWVSGTAFPLLDHNGELLGYRGMDSDITQRKQAELAREALLATAERTRQTLLNLLEDQKLAAEERIRLVAAIEQVADMIVITDPQGGIQYVNPAFERTTGHSRLAVLGQNPRLLKSGHQDEAFYRELWRTISSGQTWQGRIVNYVAVKRDVTEQLRALEEHAKLQEQLQQAQKVESIGRLAGGIAHDFNNMLSVILGYAERLLDGLPPADPLRDDARQIVESAQRSASLTRQLLAFSRRQTLQSEVLDLNAVARNLSDVLRRLIGEQIELELVLADDLCRVLADPGQIEHVIINLAINARDAMPKNGKLVIQTANVVLDEADVRTQVGLTPGTHAMLVVSDTGCGMDRDTLTHIFEPFFTTKEKGKGTGLGLATAYGVIQQSGGQITIESELGRGTTVRIYLPQTLAEPSPKPEQAAVEKSSGDGRQILVAEDEGALRALIERELSKLGYQIQVASNGREALRLVEQGLRPELLLTDVVMPEMNGTVLVEHLRRIQPDLKVLYMSGYTDDLNVHQIALEPGMHFLAKPFRSRELAAKVREVLQPETAVSRKHAKHILMIDDEAPFRELMRHFCTKRGHEFVGVGSAKAALDALAAQPFDVLLLDMNLRGTDGKQILQEIRNKGYDTPTIVLTGDLFSVDLESLRPLGVMHAVEKSADGVSLLQTIDNLEG